MRFHLSPDNSLLVNYRNVEIAAQEHVRIFRLLLRAASRAAFS